MTIDVRKYNSEFVFKTIVGLVQWINKENFNAKYDERVRFKPDMDMELQQLLTNRVILVPSYLRAEGSYDRNKGGNTTDRNTRTIYEDMEYLNSKWGRYITYNPKNNTTKIHVKR